MEIDQRRLPSSARWSRREIDRLLRAVVRYLGRRARGELSVSFLTEAAMRRINRQRRGHDRTTDVLSFALGTPRQPLGEVLISFVQARKQAKEEKVAIRQKVAQLMIHGILHTFGFDHEIPSQARRMLPLERKIFRSYVH